MDLLNQSPSQSSGEFTVPLSTVAHQQARQFAAAQATPQKGKQVYLNTLAVWAVQRYLHWLQIETRWEESDSWNQHTHALRDVADLALPGLGKLECRPILPDQSVMALPIAPDERIGYVAVRFADKLHEATLLGFVAAAHLSDSTETIAIAQLQPFDRLLDCLAEIQPAIAPPTAHLRRWLQEQVEAGWQTLEEVLGGRSLSLAFRWMPMQRAKVIELAGQRLALIVTITSMAEPMGLHLQLSSIDGSIPLPAPLTFKVLTAAGDVFREITTRAGDAFLQYELTADRGEAFAIEVECHGVQIRESFVA
ncbi:MAG: DUF1822 family protein [Leptolyngbyaceae cyanobacterium SL_7_1]|nr:DUF1822 family protein [Leptolyngbyaceae cyanobacterium SL_7_1]